MDDKIRQGVMAGPLLFLLTIAPVGCGVDNPAPPPTASLVSIAVTPVNPSIAPGTTQQFTATGIYSNGSHITLTSVTWISSNTAIANVSNGLATATMATGQTTITATYNGLSGSTSLTLSPVSSIAVTPASPPSIAPGTTAQFAATGTLANSTLQTLTTWAAWNSSDPTIATVGTTGLATATSPGPGGTAPATITAAYTGVSGTATLTSSALSSIAVTPATASIAKGTTQQFAATGTLTDANTQTLTTLATWFTSSSGVATISNAAGSQGRATAVNLGTASITSFFTGVTSSPATLTVTAALLTSLTVTPVNPSIVLGKTRQFIAMGTFTGGSTQNLTSSVTWNSSAPGVATISNIAGFNGLATSQGVGSTTISATSGTISNSTTLTVTPVVLESIVVAPASATIAGGTNLQYFATGIFTDGSTHNVTTLVTWHSSNETVATISNIAGFQGLAAATFLFGGGSTNITATLSGITSNAALLATF